MVKAPAVEIRRLEAAELALLGRSMPSSFHRRRLDLQASEDVDYLIAWQGEEAVGHLLLRWQGPTEEYLRERVESIPYIEALAVKEELRSRGIGSRLLAFAEARVRERGLAKLGLAVGVENLAALALYARRGYQLADLDPYDVSLRYVDHDGGLNVETERCFYMVKRLAE